MKAITNNLDYQITQENDVSLLCSTRSLFFSLWRLYPIPDHGLVLEGFSITRIGHTTLGTTLLDE
jgi:hypothetical protein